MPEDLKAEDKIAVTTRDSASGGDQAASGAASGPDRPTGATLGEQAPKLRIEPGTVIADRFEIIRYIADGAYAEVFEARHKLLGTQVALKMLKCTGGINANALERFRREAQTVSTLNHPGIVRMLDYGLTEDRRPFIVMDLIEGRPLDELLAFGETLTPSECITLFSELCDTLSCAHKAGVVHRDLKPANIIVSGSGSERRLKVVDFGLARTMDDDPDAKNRLTQTGDVVGTPYYMSPEQCLGHLPDERSDVYSLACVMYQSLCGKMPFPGPATFDVMRQHVEEPPIPLSKQQPDLKKASALERVILKGLAKDRDHRFQSMQEMREALLAVRKGTNVLAFWQNTGVHAKAGRRRRGGLDRLIWGIGGVALAGIMLACALPTFLGSIDQNAESKWNRYNREGQEALTNGRYHDASRSYGLAAKLALSFAHDVDKQQWQERYRQALEREALSLHLEGAKGSENAIDDDLSAAKEEWKKANADKDGLLMQLWHVFPNEPSASQRAEFLPLSMRVLDVAHKYCDDKRFEEALALTNETIDKADRVFAQNASASAQAAPAEYRDVRARALYEEGRVLNGMHQHSRSEALLREAVQLFSDKYGENSLQSAKAQYQLAISLIRQKQNEEGQQWLDKAMQGFKANGFSEGTGFALEAQGAIYANEQKYDAALEQYKSAMAVQQNNHDYDAVRNCIDQICWFYTVLRKVPDGEAFLEKTIEETVKTGRNADLDRAYLNLMLGRFEENLGKLQNATRCYREAVDIYQNYFAPSDKVVTSAMADLARCARRSGDDKLADRMMDELQAINQRNGER